MRICLSCVEKNAWSVFGNTEKCFLCLPYGAPSYVLNKADEREYRRLSRCMNWGPRDTPRMPSKKDLEALERFRSQIIGGVEE